MEKCNVEVLVVAEAKKKMITLRKKNDTRLHLKIRTIAIQVYFL